MLPTMLPLPTGEGRGEGEQIVRIPEGCDFCNRHSAVVPLCGISDFDLRVSAFACVHVAGTMRCKTSAAKNKAMNTALSGRGASAAASQSTNTIPANNHETVCPILG